MSFGVTAEKNLACPDYAHANTLRQLLQELLVLRDSITSQAETRLAGYDSCYLKKHFSESAVNLAHYLSFRQHDLRPLQDRLAIAGLSSLGRAEAVVLPNIDAIIDILQRATNKSYAPVQGTATRFGFDQGKRILQQNTVNLFGQLKQPDKTHIMVTLDVQAAWNFNLVKALLQQGMTCARINCAHDKPKDWGSMIENVRKAEAETGHSCRILMDLAGHKIRTGEIAKEHPVHHIKVKKDRSGEVVASGFLVLSVETDASDIETDLFRIPIPQELHKKLAPGMSLKFLDNQKKQRFLKIEKALSPNDWLVSCDKPAYIASGCKVRLIRPDYPHNSRKDNTFLLGKFDGDPLDIRVFKDESLLLTKEGILGRPAEYSDTGTLIRPAHIGCTLSSATRQLEIGHPVWIDDGKIGAVVENISEQGALLRITHAKRNGVRLHGDKGINFPETDLQLPPLSDKDLRDLDFVSKHANIVGFSFVESLADMQALRAELRRRKAGHLPIIAKIETNRAVRNLPDILLGTMGQHRIGIMIARGDLAVELGSARLAEIQEELLWICEAAHVPVIWATQVLESVTKKGVKSRPEFTDAAMAARAECVMLNKGPYILDAIEALVNVMNRMDEHQHKKFSRLRALHW